MSLVDGGTWPLPNTQQMLVIVKYVLRQLNLITLMSIYLELCQDGL